MAQAIEPCQVRNKAALKWFKLVGVWFLKSRCFNLLIMQMVFDR